MSKHCQHSKRFKKLFYYGSSFLHQKLYPAFLKQRYKSQCYALLKNPNLFERVFKRVNYYCKIDQSFELTHHQISAQCGHTLYKVQQNDLFSLDCASVYRNDTARYMSYFSDELYLNFLPGDITEAPELCSVVKSRPVSSDLSNANSCLLKLNAIRHFHFIHDRIAFSEKKPKLVWRGAAHQPHRQAFLEQFHDHAMMNVGQVGQPSCKTHKNTMSISEQLDYQFILCIEGNDVATNLKWGMSSNSLCFMTKPKYETWFMEGLLIPGFHYVEVRDDYSDLVEKLHYYTNHPKEAENLIRHANAHCRQFMSQREEDLTAFLVLEKFFHCSGQLQSPYADYFNA